jgi:hypothetical protein
VAGAALLITTLAVLDLPLSLVKQRSEWFQRLTEGAPLKERLNRLRIDEGGVLQPARETQEG